MALNPKLERDVNGIWWLKWTSDPDAIAYDILIGGKHVQAGKKATESKLGGTKPDPLPQIAGAKPGVYETAVDTTAPPPVSFTAETNLKDGQEITGPVDWTATFSAPVARVDFMIEGQTKWTEYQSPYTFNGDPGGKFDPKTLPNGKHLLTVVGSATSGEKATVSINVTVNVSLPPPPPPPDGVSEGRVKFWMYGTSQVDYVINDVSKQPWMKAKWDALEGWLDSEPKWHPGVFKYDDSIAIYTTSALATQHPDWILKDSAGNKLKFYSSVQYLADPGNPDYQDFKANEVASFIAKGYAGVKLDDVNQDKVSNSSAINPRTGKVYTLPEWQKDIANLVSKIAAKCRAIKSGFKIAGNILYWATGPDVDKCLDILDYAQLERGFNDPNFSASSIQRVWQFVDKLHAMGTGAIHLSEASGMQAAHFNIACALLCSNGNDYAYGVGWKPEAWDTIYDTDLGDNDGDRFLVSGSLYRRNFKLGYATADIIAKVGSVVKY